MSGSVYRSKVLLRSTAATHIGDATMHIGYLTDLCKPYVESLKAATTEQALEKHINEWELLAGDAADAFRSAKFVWKEFITGRRKENRGVYAGDQWAEKYGAIMMPELLMKIGMLAQDCLVPEGCVYIRLRDSGKIVERSGRAVWIDKEQ